MVVHTRHCEQIQKYRKRDRYKGNCTSSEYFGKAERKLDSQKSILGQAQRQAERSGRG